MDASVMSKSTGNRARANSVASTANGSLLSRKSWELYTPPPFNSLRGALVPQALQKHHKRRKICVEIYRIYNELETDQHSASSWFDECVVRVMDPDSPESRKEALERAKRRRRQKKEESASVASGDALEDGYDDDMSTVVPDDFLEGGADANHSSAPDKGWKAKYRFPIRALNLKETQKTTVTVEIDFGRIKQRRQLVFDSQEHAEEFKHVINYELSLEEGRREKKLSSALKGVGTLPTGDITFLVEIVSGWDLPAGDFYTSDPYVICMMDGKELHRTKFISRTLDPIFTLKHDSLFLLNIDLKSLFLSEGLLCIVMDFDKVGSNERLGSIIVPPKVLYDAKGERIEFKLGPPPGRTREVPGYLALRVRRASEYDIEFMKEFKSSKNSRHVGIREAVAIATESKGGVGNIKSYFTRQTRMHHEGEKVVKQYKVRPGPDPKRVAETTWMAKDDIDRACMKESQHWIDTGSGRLGRLFVEILGCSGLPNLDSGARNKTDTFVSIVFEDSIAKTDIIDDCLNPRWLPWSKRAFIFHIFHSSSQLFLGVFDYDDGINLADDHDLVGRVSIDLSNLRKDTMYTLTYNIFTSARMSERTRNGSITVRIRLDTDDERKVLLSNLEPPPEMYVNVRKRKDFRVVRYTCTGKFDMSRYDMKYINSYIEELLALQHTLFYLNDAGLYLLLWRGTMPINLFGKEYLFPIHSFSAFVAAVLLVERPQMLPSVFFAAVAWILLAVMDYRSKLPDVWSRCKTYGEFLQVLAFGESPRSADSIQAYHNYEDAQAFLQNWQQRIANSEEAAARAYEESAKAQSEWEKEMEEIGELDTDISTKLGGISIDPFKSILFPVQQNLAVICRYVRHLKFILFWEECYISFWVVTGCLLLSFMFMFVPWFFLIKWIARIIAWTFFGPLMKLVDIHYVSKIKPRTEEEIEEQRLHQREKRRMMTTAAASEARVKRENAAKLKAMKRYMFGKFITKVPVLKEDRYRDLPLPSSSAVPYRPSPLPLSQLAMQEAGYNRTRIPGQHLTGDMIPKAETKGFTEAPIGQATAHPKLLDSNGPGGIAKGAGAPVSTAAAYAKIGSVFASAAVISWFIVPILSSLTEKAVQWAA